MSRAWALFFAFGTCGPNGSDSDDDDCILRAYFTPCDEAHYPAEARCDTCGGYWECLQNDNSEWVWRRTNAQECPIE